MFRKKKYEAVFNVIEENKEVGKLQLTLELPMMISAAEVMVSLQREISRKFDGTLPYKENHKNVVVLEKLVCVAD